MTKVLEQQIQSTHPPRRLLHIFEVIFLRVYQFVKRTDFFQCFLIIVEQMHIHTEAECVCFKLFSVRKSVYEAISGVIFD